MSGFQPASQFIFPNKSGGEKTVPIGEKTSPALPPAPSPESFPTSREVGASDEVSPASSTILNAPAPGPLNDLILEDT